MKTTETTMEVKTRMKRVMTALALASLPLALACEPGAPALEVRTFTLTHMSGSEAAELIDPYVYGGREGAEGRLSAVMNAITVRETSDNLDQIERVLAEHDVERPDVRLHFQLIQADGYADDDPRISEVEAELRRIFRFVGYRLAGEAMVSATSASDLQQRFSGTEDTYMITAEAQRLSPGVIRLEEVTLWGPVAGRQEPILQTSINIRPGQTLVLGSSPQGGGATLLLTVRAEEL